MEKSKLVNTPVPLDEFFKDIVSPALKILGGRFNSPEARVMLATIAQQESRLTHRWQVVDLANPEVKGPARGLFQFERAGGVKGVLSHPASKSKALNLCSERRVPVDLMSVWLALESDDILAAGLARLLLWTDPKPLPAVNDVDGAWELYLRVWRPGMPHIGTWAGFHRLAREYVAAQ